MLDQLLANLCLHLCVQLTVSVPVPVSVTVTVLMTVPASEVCIQPSLMCTAVSCFHMGCTASRETATASHRQISYGVLAHTSNDPRGSTRLFCMSWQAKNTWLVCVDGWKVGYPAEVAPHQQAAFSSSGTGKGGHEHCGDGINGPDSATVTGMGIVALGSPPSTSCNFLLQELGKVVMYCGDGHTWQQSQGWVL